MTPAERARVWGICGGMPFYLGLWDGRASVRANLTRLFCTEHALLLNEGELVLSTEDFFGSRERLPGRLLRAITGGSTRFAELRQALGTDPTRALQATQELDLVQRIEPVRSGSDSRRAVYQIADNFLAFWLTIVEPHRSAIAQGLGSEIAKAMESQLDDFMGDRWEEAFRAHRVRVAPDLNLPEPVVQVGRYWRPASPGRGGSGRDGCGRARRA